MGKLGKYVPDVASLCSNAYSMSHITGDIMFNHGRQCHVQVV